MDFGIVAAILAIATVASTTASIKAAKAQNKAQKKANRIQQRIGEVQSIRERRQAIAARNIQNANLEAAGVEAGIQGSSALRGVQGSLGSSTASNIGFANSAFAAERSISNTLLRGQLKAQKYQTIAGVADTIGSLSASSIQMGIVNPSIGAGGGSKPPPFNLVMKRNS